MKAEDIKEGDSVYVDFVIYDEVAKDGDDVKRFKGCAVVDLCEDGRVYGRLKDGTPFTCSEDDVRRISDVNEYCKSLDKALMFAFLVFGVLALKLAGVI